MNYSGKETFLISYPKLEKNKNYIFACGHSFPGDVANNLSVIDRNVYTLVGTTDQIDHNPEMYFLWINGIIYVNKLSSDSRKDSFKKMKRILEQKSSIMLFPEGVLNNTENKNCLTPYPGFYHLSNETGVPIVPMVSNYNHENNTVFVAAGNPLNIDELCKEEVMKLWKDEIATLRFNLSRITYDQAKSLDHILSFDEFINLNPNLNVEVYRCDLVGDLHLKYMELRKQIYNEVKWTNGDCWEEEITPYVEKNVINEEDVLNFIDKVNLSDKNKDTIEILKPVLVKSLRYKKYDFKDYMKNNWNK